MDQRKKVSAERDPSMAVPSAEMRRSGKNRHNGDERCRCNPACCVLIWMHSAVFESKKKNSKKAGFCVYQSVLIWSLNSTLHDEQTKSEALFGVSSSG